MLANCILAFSMLGVFVAVPADAQDAATNIMGPERSAAFFATNPTGDFNATGRISSVLSDRQTYILAGNWNLLVSDGNITDFRVKLTMVSVDGTERHTHTVTNFRPNTAVPVILDVHGTVFTGVTDMSVNGNVEWHSVQTTVAIAKHDVIEILLNSSQNLEGTDNHFGGQPIYGVVFSIQDYRAN